MRHASHLRAAARAVGVAVIAALTFSACAAGSASGATPTGPTRVVIDIAGTEVTVPEHPERVVALSEPALDGLLALGVTPIGTVTGRGQSAVPNYLAELAGEVPVLGGIAQPNFEAIGAAQPDLIVVDGTSVNNNPPVIAALRQIAPVVYTGYAGGDWKVNFRHVADALNMVDVGEEVIAAYEGRIAAARPQLSEYADSTFSIVRWQGNSAAQASATPARAAALTSTTPKTPARRRWQCPALANSKRSRTTASFSSTVRHGHRPAAQS